jgi:riboflavin kinase
MRLLQRINHSYNDVCCTCWRIRQHQFLVVAVVVTIVFVVSGPAKLVVVQAFQQHSPVSSATTSTSTVKQLQGTGQRRSPWSSSSSLSFIRPICIWNLRECLYCLSSSRSASSSSSSSSDVETSEPKQVDDTTTNRTDSDSMDFSSYRISPNAITTSTSTAAAAATTVMYQFRGIVETGYGRGGKQLGVPTANLGPSPFFHVALTNISTGVYFGFAVLERHSIKNNDDDVADVDMVDRCMEENDTDHMSPIYNAVVNIGYSPTFVGQENKRKIIEAHLLSSSSPSTPMLDFYNRTMRLQLIAYLRPEMKFPSLSDLIQQITNDITTACRLLIQEPYATSYRNDTFLISQSESSSSIWIGRNGGTATASYEIIQNAQPN